MGRLIAGGGRRGSVTEVPRVGLRHVRSTRRGRHGGRHRDREHAVCRGRARKQPSVAQRYARRQAAAAASGEGHEAQGGAREGDGGEDPSHEATQMPADRNSRDDEAQGEVQ